MLDQALPLPHVAVVVQRRLWNLDLGCRSSCHYCVLALMNPISEIVGTGRHAWNDQWKVEGCAHQATVQWCPGCVQFLMPYANGEKYETVCALFAAVSNALTVFGCFEDSVLLQPLESRLTELETRLHGPRLVALQDDWMLESFRGARCALLEVCKIRNHSGVRLCKLGTSFPVLHVIVVSLCWLCKPGIVSGTLCTTFVDRCRMHPAVLCSQVTE